MFCTHCGKEINEEKIEKSKSSFEIADGKCDSETKVEYVCPRCQRLVHSDLDEEDVKALARASHAEIQRGNNSFANGMVFNCVGGIILIISFIFFRLSRKAANNFQLSTNCIEFWVFVVTLVLSIVFICFGVVKVILGLTKKNKYTAVLKDIQNGTFVQ